MLFKKREITKGAVLRPVFLHVLINDWSKKYHLLIILFYRFRRLKTNTDRGSLNVIWPGSKRAFSINRHKVMDMVKKSKIHGEGL